MVGGREEEEKQCVCVRGGRRCGGGGGGEKCSWSLCVLGVVVTAAEEVNMFMVCGSCRGLRHGSFAVRGLWVGLSEYCIGGVDDGLSTVRAGLDTPVWPFWVGFLDIGVGIWLII